MNSSIDIKSSIELFRQKIYSTVSEQKQQICSKKETAFPSKAPEMAEKGLLMHQGSKLVR